MPRIVAGLAKGRPLAVPGRGTRPTSDRAREALFNTLRTHLDLDGARVLDLFAGSGAVGLEALSRGAASATFVESDRAAQQVLRRNIAAVGLPGAVVERRGVADVLATGPAGAGGADGFDLVFADPPYALPDDEVTALLAALAGHGWLAADALVVVERSSRGPQLRWPETIALVTHRRYGEAMLWYGRPR